MLETKCVGDKFKMFVADLRCSPSYKHQHNVVTNITVTFFYAIPSQNPCPEKKVWNEQIAIFITLTILKHKFLILTI